MRGMGKQTHKRLSRQVAAAAAQGPRPESREAAARALSRWAPDQPLAQLITIVAAAIDESRTVAIFDERAGCAKVAQDLSEALKGGFANLAYDDGDYVAQVIAQRIREREAR